MKKIAAAIAMTASLFVAIASNAEIIPQTIILPPTIGGWQGEWGILPWYPQFRNRKPGEARYIRRASRSGSIVTIEKLKRVQLSFEPKGSFNYYILIERFNCSANTSGHTLFTRIEPETTSNNGIYTIDGAEIQFPKIRIVNKYYYVISGNASTKSMEMNPVMPNTYGSAVHDAVCKHIK